MPDEVVYVSNVRLERIAGPSRLAYLPAEANPIHFGVHGAIAEHYGFAAERVTEPHATTIDYLIAAVGG